MYSSKTFSTICCGFWCFVVTGSLADDALNAAKADADDNAAAADTGGIMWHRHTAGHLYLIISTGKIECVGNFRYKTIIIPPFMI